MTKYKSNDNIRGHIFSEPHICIVRHSHRHIAHNIFFYLRVQVKTERCTTPPPPRPPILFSAPTTSPAVGPPYRVSKNTPYIALHTLPPLHNYCTTLTPPPPTVFRNVATSSDCRRRNSLDSGAPALFSRPSRQELLEAELEFHSRASVLLPFSHSWERRHFWCVNILFLSIRIQEIRI